MSNRSRQFRSASPLLLLLTLFAGCGPGYEIIEAPADIRLSVWEEAQLYLGMEYEWGGQDTPKGIDCSGLVVNCYAAAVDGTGYRLLFDDTTAKNLSEQYTTPMEAPETGDLVFMGEDDTVSHVAILEKTEEGMIWFIDASSVSGYVEYRSYETENPKILGYGRILILAPQ